MMEVCQHTDILIQSYKYDPSRTTGLRNAFAGNMNKRFTEFVLAVYATVAKKDCFGLEKNNIFQSYQMALPRDREFEGLKDSEKINAFMKWIAILIATDILTMSEYQQMGRLMQGAWMNTYILEAYKRSVARARYELKKAGYAVPSIEASGGIETVMMNIVHMERVGLLYTRIFNDLKGITDAMSSQISRVLAQGIMNGDGMKLLARKLVATINGTGAEELGITDTLGRFIPAARRAEMLVRTEIIRAYAEATLQEFRNWGVEGVTAQAEFRTAGDDRVCPECASLEGKVYSLDEASGIIPVHPKCRCIWLPYIESIQKYK